jgi:hypothetical protein
MVTVNHADKRDLRVADPGGQQRQILEALLGLGVEDVVGS